MRLVLFAAIAASLTFGADSTPAKAKDDAYWHGKRGPVWQDGPRRGLGLSNWYTKPPGNGGRMSRPPTDVAAFSDLASELKVWVDKPDPDQPKNTFTRVNTIYMLEDAPQYEFEILTDARFGLGGQGTRQGMINASEHVPTVLLRPRSIFEVTGEATFKARQEITSARISIDNAEMRFRDLSGGGDSTVQVLAGKLNFSDESSAENMEITAGVIFNQRSTVAFSNRSDGGHADFAILNNASLDFSQTRGPNGDGRISAGWINLYGELHLGTNTLTVDVDYAHPHNGGYVYVELRGKRIGNIVVKGKADQLRGTLDVKPFPLGQPAARGRYRVFKFDATAPPAGFSLTTPIPGAFLDNDTPGELWLVVP
ncbi:hypothetical protein [Hansschlegelia zhihuaiae]|uniref:Uncharacterized protein n=1 Tax=Hansschlegelia zhihuaiae TaxID=405005 RepID=A0A4Q0MJN9_9HYPH|nr:hypothetical protein [Hansschlegelia zhihuaiae]RXF73784.1 hypothetical protein EK403_09375 [Hansschlegelia zhihuaiae]